MTADDALDALNRDLIARTDGRAFVLFTSYAFLRKAAEVLLGAGAFVLPSRQFAPP